MSDTEDPFQVIINDDALVVLDQHRHHIADIPLAQVTGVESDIYQHPLVTSKGLPSVRISFAKRGSLRDSKEPFQITGIYNTVGESLGFKCLIQTLTGTDTITLQTIKDMWDLPRVLREAVHTCVLVRNLLQFSCLTALKVW